MGNYSKEVSKRDGCYVFLLKKLMAFFQTRIRENQQDIWVGESCGKWLYTKNIIGPQCKEMLKTLQGNVKHAKGKKMKYTPAIRVFILPWLHIHSTVRGWFYRTYKPPSEGCIWILVATELFTKWVEAVTLKKATSSSVANFLWENIICRFGVPNKIISDNSTPFLNKDVCHLTNWYFISHIAFTPYYPKGNGQVEAFNKRQLKILGKMTKENGKGWKEELFIALWAHITAKSQATRAAPFFLVYGTKAITLIDLVRPAVKLAEIARIPREGLNCLHNCLYLANMKASHKGQIKEKKF